MLEQIIFHPDFLLYANIPVVAAFVGWVTNWVAIQLMFYPINFIGYRPLYLGWQGIVPKRADKMAKVVVEKGLSSLAKISDMYNELDHASLKEQFVALMDSSLETYIDAVMEEEYATVWVNMPALLRNRMVANVRKQLPQVIENMMKDAGSRIDELIDLEHMVSTQLVENPVLLNRIFQEAGAAEFKFIINSGIYFGLAFGLVQMGVWFFIPEWWILPLFGLIVGYATNAIALKIIFKPLHPIKIGPFVLQGLFLKRQKEVAAVLCRITTTEVITIRNLLKAMITGPRSQKMRALVNKHIKKAVDDAANFGFGVGKPVTQAALGFKGFAHLKIAATDRAWDFASAELLNAHGFNQVQEQIIEKMLRERMEALSPEEFQDVLRPAFQQDEWILIMLGAVLGLLAGLVQMYWVFGGL